MVKAAFVGMGLALALVVCPSASTVQQPDHDVDALEACLLTGWPRDVLELCTGVVADPCQADTEGTATMGMTGCLVREAAAWEALLSRMWPRMMMRAREIDAANQTDALDIDSATETLRTAQRTWEVFRDAECRYSHASWGEGEFRTVAHAACLLDLTARRVADLYARLSTGG